MPLGFIEFRELNCYGCRDFYSAYGYYLYGNSGLRLFVYVLNSFLFISIFLSARQNGLFGCFTNFIQKLAIFSSAALSWSRLRSLLERLLGFLWFLYVSGTANSS